VAAGNVSDRAVLVGDDGKPVNDGLTFAEGVDATTPGALRLTPFALADGAWPKGADQVAIEAGTADREDITVGDHVRIAARGPARAYTVSAIVRFSGVDSLGAKTSAVVFDLPTAQALFDKQGRYDSVLVAAREGADPAALRRDLAAALPGQKVTTAADEDRFSLDELSTVVSVVRTVLTAFGILAVLIGAFTILNTMSIAVAQRTRELALLRMVGGSRAQARRLILTEALLLGLGASVAGLVAGFGLAKLLDGVLASVGLDLPHSGLVIGPSAVIVALLVGTLATVVAGLVPARRATRVTPMAALTQATAGARRRGRVLGPVVGALAWPSAKVGGVAGALARRNALRNPGRTALTATALAIGVALMTVVLVATAGFRSFERSSLEHRIQAQQVVYGADGWSPIPDTVEAAVADTPGVRAVTSLRQDGTLAFGGRERINAVDPATVGGLFDFDWVDGSPDTLRSLGADGAVLDSGFASEHGLAVGDRFTVTSAAGTQVALVVRGIERSPVLDMMNLGPITVSAEAFADGGWSTQDRTITLADTTDPGALARTVARFPEAQLDTGGDWIDSQLAGLDGVVALFGVLLALCVIVSLLGIANALVLATFERTRELGMLRALGMSRRQLRRLVRAESIVTALLGAVLGAVAGLGLAAIVTTLLADQGLQFVIPATGLVVFVVLAVLAGVVAAALPARRAARMDVLSALAHE
jgi:putative ABC transport system permease protein